MPVVNRSPGPFTLLHGRFGMSAIAVALVGCAGTGTLIAEVVDAARSPSARCWSARSRTPPAPARARWRWLARPSARTVPA
jgi:hypothetical protein